MHKFAYRHFVYTDAWQYTFRQNEYSNANIYLLQKHFTNVFPLTTAIQAQASASLAACSGVSPS